MKIHKNTKIKKMKLPGACLPDLNLMHNNSKQKILYKNNTGLQYSEGDHPLT